MDRTKRCFLGLVWTVAIVAVLTATNRLALGQEAANEPGEDKATEPDRATRVLHVENHLRALASHHERLQQRYDALARQYKMLQQQAREPVFGAGNGNADGKGIPNGAYFPSSLVTQQEQTGEEKSAAKEEQKKRGSYEAEEADGEGKEEESAPRTLLGGTMPSRGPRRQSGLGGAGTSEGPRSPRQNLEEYANDLGSYQPDKRPPRLPLTASFSQGLELRSTDELYARFANMQLGDQIFTSGIANPKYWTNRVSATDIGANWYLNNYVRIYLD